MPFYQRLGDVPRKRHIQFREHGTLLVEEVMGLEGVTGNESILYHLQWACRCRSGEGDQWLSGRGGRGGPPTMWGPGRRMEEAYVVVPGGTTHRSRPEGLHRHPLLETPGRTESPRRYRNQYGQIMEGAPY